MCVNANAKELAPLIYETWLDTSENFTLEDYRKNHLLANKTVLDGLFGWRGLDGRGRKTGRPSTHLLRLPSTLRNIDYSLSISKISNGSEHSMSILMKLN